MTGEPPLDSPRAPTRPTAPDAAHPDRTAELRRRFPRVAIAHDWLSTPGGSEKVVAALLEVVPWAEIFTTVYEPSLYGPPIADRPVHPSALDRLPGARRHYPKLLPLMTPAWRHFDLTGFDLVISSSHACAKNVLVADGTPHVCYSHTPIRYVWDPEFRRGERLGPVGSLAFRALLPSLRRADLRGARTVDRFLANSTVVADRIRRIYGRDATVVHPPVEVERFLSAPRRAAADAPYLVFGRIVPYKRVDLAVRACEVLDRPLVVAGTGRDLERVRALAGPRTTFLGRVDDAELAELFASSRALLFPGEEDFGIVPVEAQAAGLPVIGFGGGGVRDSVVDGVTGVLYDEPTLDGMVAAIRRFEALELDDGRLRSQAERFAPQRFTDRIHEILGDPFIMTTQEPSSGTR